MDNCEWNGELFAIANTYHWLFVFVYWGRAKESTGSTTTLGSTERRRTQAVNGLLLRKRIDQEQFWSLPNRTSTNRRSDSPTST